ncbi:hypothetical protein [Actinophytocola sp. NPDC049390]|uniref:hypothetical protein n=1 Tax=Actinophytocola sp. NPDC049390 TaxID=3363894 RepID=UPI0037B650C5
MDVQAVAEEIAGKADAIDGLRAFGYPIDHPPLPCAVVVLPDEVTYDQTYGRGSDRMTVPLFVFVPRSPDRVAADALAAYLSGSGAKSIKAAVDSTDSNTYTSCDEVTVTRAVTGSYTYNNKDVYGAEFTVDIAGRGGA